VAAGLLAALPAALRELRAAAGGKAQGGGRERQSGDSTPRPRMRRLQGEWWRRMKLGAFLSFHSYLIGS